MILRSVLLLVLFSASPASAQWKFSFYEPVQPARKVQVMVHRGMQMLAPENSLPAILACADDYLEWAEIDVRLTKDGQHIVIHNSTVDATTDGKGNVNEFTLEELKKLDSGAWFSSRFRGTRLQSLAEVLAATKNRVNLYLDCKRIDPELLVREIRDAKMESQVVVYAGLDVLAKVRAAGGNDVAIMAKFRPKDSAIDEFIARVNPMAVEVDAGDVSKELCEQFHKRGIKVQAQVLGHDVDVPSTWNRMIEFGVDWLQTDDPVGIRFADARRRISKFPVQFACHRGANFYTPENSIPAIRLAAAIGADYIEIDIRTTMDGQFVLLHDGTLNRTTNGTGPVKQQNLDAVLALDCGAWFGRPFTSLKVPRFSEGLDAMGTTSHAYLDAKDIPPEALVEAIRKHNLMNRHAVYQSAEYCQKLKELDPDVRLMPPLRSAESLDKLLELKPYAVDANWKILSKDLIARCHAANIRVFSDALGIHETVDHYRQAIGWGIDVIQTDYPLRVLRAIELTAK